VVDRVRIGDAEERSPYGTPGDPGVSREEKDCLGPRVARSDGALRRSNVLDATGRGGHAQGSGRSQEIPGSVPERAERHYLADQRIPLEAKSYYFGCVIKKRIFFETFK